MRKRLLVGIALVLGMAACAGCSSEGADVAVDSGSVTVDGSSVDAGPGAFGAACTGSGQGTCATGLTCFPFNNDGPHCTKPCTAATAATACAPSTLGCSGMNVCKIR